MDNNFQKIRVKIAEVRAKQLPIECPVCHGFGTLKYGTKVCQACEGKGYILVPTEGVKNER